MYLGPLAASEQTSGIIAGVVVAVILVLLVVLYFTNDKFKATIQQAFKALTDLAQTQSKWTITRIGDTEYNNLLAHLSSIVTSKGYIPTSQQPGFYAYQKQEKPSCLIGLILLLICLIPGILYLFLAGKTKVVTIKVTQTQDGYIFDVKAPGGIERQIKNAIAPYKPVEIEQ